MYDQIRLHSIDKQDPEWTTRGYNVHLDKIGSIQMLNLHLYDSVPALVIEQWKQQLAQENLQPTNAEYIIRLRSQIETFEDGGRGQCFLANPSIAELVMDTLRHWDGILYVLYTWCLMSNHLHLVLRTLAHWSKITNAIKWYTAKHGNEILNHRNGPFWMPEYFDRKIRNADHYWHARRYTLQNPLKVGYTMKYTGCVTGNPFDPDWKDENRNEATTEMCRKLAGGQIVTPGEYWRTIVNGE